MIKIWKHWLFFGKLHPLDPILGVNCEYKIYRLSFCNVEQNSIVSPCQYNHDSEREGRGLFLSGNMWLRHPVKKYWQSNKIIEPHLPNTYEYTYYIQNTERESKSSIQYNILIHSHCFCLPDLHLQHTFLQQLLLDNSTSILCPKNYKIHNPIPNEDRLINVQNLERSLH